MTEIELLKLLIFIIVTQFAYKEFKEILKYVSKLFGGGVTGV